MNYKLLNGMTRIEMYDFIANLIDVGAFEREEEE